MNLMSLTFLNMNTHDLNETVDMFKKTYLHFVVEDVVLLKTGKRTCLLISCGLTLYVISDFLPTSISAFYFRPCQES